MTIGAANLRWGRLLIEKLLSHSIDYFCLSPGSRNTPIVLGVAGNPEATSLVHFDERGAAFHALGYARATGRPVVVITTSGTAVANLFPAVAEAANDHLPLVLLTADRPPELQHCGANQTMPQSGIFGDHVRFAADLPCPDDQGDPSLMLSVIDRAMSAATGENAGPVHLNCIFREPLIPDGSVEEPPVPVSDHAQDQQTTAVRADDDNLGAPDWKTVEAIVNDTQRGLIVVGRLDLPSEREAVLKLAGDLGWPTLPDITSGLRLADDRSLISYYDLILNASDFSAQYRPETVLHLGGQYVSKRLLNCITASRPKHHLHVDWRAKKQDPGGTVTHRLTMSLVDFCSQLRPEKHRAQVTPYFKAWQIADHAVGRIVNEQLELGNELSEAKAARLLTTNLPDKQALFIASSMPIRDLDSYGAPGAGMRAVGANRGVSGIDGTIASAAGYAVGLRRGVTLLIGDLACLHDLNSLSLLNQIDYPVTVVLINNNGGRIFENLAVAKYKEIVEPFFVVPHALSFASAAEMFHLLYRNVKRGAELAEALRSGYSSGKPSLIEVTIDHESSLACRHQIVRLIADRIDKR